MITCRNCGATMEETDATCPYCGAMHAEGAERKFMGHLYGMKEDLRRSVDASEKTIRRSISRSAVVMSICMVGIVLVISIFNLGRWKMEEWQERRYEEEQYEEILWKDEHYEYMDGLYEQGNLQGILNHLAEEDAGIWSVSDWEHMQVVYAYQICCEIEEARVEWRQGGYSYLMESAFADAFTVAVYEKDMRRERIATEADQVRFDEYLLQMRSFLEEDFGMTEVDLEYLLRETEKEGYASYSLLADYAAARLGIEEE